MTEYDPAPRRFAILSMLRVVAALMVVAGIVIAFGSRDIVPRDMKWPVGGALMLIGFVDILVLIPLFARRWRSPSDEQ